MAVAHHVLAALADGLSRVSAAMPGFQVTGVRVIGVQATGIQSVDFNGRHSAGDDQLLNRSGGFSAPELQRLIRKT